MSTFADMACSTIPSSVSLECCHSPKVRSSLFGNLPSRFLRLSDRSCHDRSLNLSQFGSSPARPRAVLHQIHRYPILPHPLLYDAIDRYNRIAKGEDGV